MEPQKFDDKTNFQYLRNVIYRFLTDLHTRNQLVPVLVAIFKFTTEEQAKIASAVSSAHTTKRLSIGRT
jgi:hypothetical protein